MKELWRVLSFVISLMGFLIAAGSALLQGEELFWTITKGVVAFVALWAVQSVLRALLGLTLGSESPQNNERRKS
jgi:hypothetical protein